MSISKQITRVDGTKKRIGNYAHVRANRLKKKLFLVETFGGKCIVCGYSKCLSALHFHHRNPKEKKFGISSVGNGYSLEMAIDEAKKCDLLCANCHHEAHEKMVVLERLSLPTSRLSSTHSDIELQNQVSDAD